MNIEEPFMYPIGGNVTKDSIYGNPSANKIIYMKMICGLKKIWC